MIDREGPIPIRHQLKDLLREKILGGDWAVGAMIPTEKELMREYGVGRPSLRAAIAGLIEEGLLYRRHGKGTHVLREYPIDEVEPLLSFAAEMTLQGYSVAGLLLEGKREEVPVDFKVPWRLRRGEKVFHVKKLCHANGIPMAIEESHLVLRLVPGLERQNLLWPLYETIFHRLGVPFLRASQVAWPDLPTAGQAELLGIKAFTPVLTMERVVFTTGDEPLALVRMTYRGDLYRRRVGIRPTGGR